MMMKPTYKMMTSKASWLINFNKNRNTWQNKAIRNDLVHINNWYMWRAIVHLIIWADSEIKFKGKNKKKELLNYEQVYSYKYELIKNLKKLTFN